MRVELDERETIVAEVGKLIFARGGVEWDVTVPGDGIVGKVVAAFKRKMSGGAVVMTTYAGPGSVGARQGAPLSRSGRSRARPRRRGQPEEDDDRLVQPPDIRGAQPPDSFPDLVFGHRGDLVHHEA